MRGGPLSPLGSHTGDVFERWAGLLETWSYVLYRTSLVTAQPPRESGPRGQALELCGPTIKATENSTECVCVG